MLLLQVGAQDPFTILETAHLDSDNFFRADLRATLAGLLVVKQAATLAAPPEEQLCGDPSRAMR